MAVAQEEGGFERNSEGEGSPGPVGAESQPQPQLDPVEALRADLAAANARAAETHDRFLRAVAEGENLRRRAQEDVSKAHKFAIESFAEALVPVADSLEKALADAGAAGLREGVEATLRQLRAAFERHRLAEINPVGERFDPHRHQAIATVPGDGTIAPNHVASVLQKGWTISDRVLRPALVSVVQGS